MSFYFQIFGRGLSVQINIYDVIWCGRTLFAYAWIKHNQVWHGERYQYMDDRFSWVVIRKGRNKTFTFQKVIRAI
jgi:hypothetical protein